MNSTTPNKRKFKLASQVLPLLGGISAEVFLRDYWQKKPLLIRNAIAGFTGPLSKSEVLTVARRNDAESRLITRDAHTWRLEHGPFSLSDFRQPKNILWTVLVQDVQHFSYEGHELLSHFAFLPNARIDDLMVSYAVAGAGVGAHFDSYDVFLLQGMGTRRWQISSQQDLRLQPDLPLKILSHFKPTAEFVLETGDMLYLPPNVAHNGIAETECLTWSIGFRAPSQQDLGVAFLDHLRDQLQLPGHYADPALTYAKDPAEIDKTMRQRIGQLLTDIQAASRDTDTIRRFIGCYFTEPKSHVVLNLPETPAAASVFARQAMRHGVELDLKTRILYDDKNVFINGEAHAPKRAVQILLRGLANQRFVSASVVASPRAKPALAFLYRCYCDGILTIARH